MSKVTVVGAGNVGATCANVLVTTGVADEVVLIDIKEGLSEGKSMDIMQTANILNINTRLTGVTNDYEKTAGSDVVVITSGNVPFNALFNFPDISIYSLYIFLKSSVWYLTAVPFEL